MRRAPALFVLCAWLLASGVQWDLVQGFAWGRMVANYSRTMPLSEAVRLTFAAENLCGVCEFVADHRTRFDANAQGTSEEAPPAATADSAAKGKLLLAVAPVHIFAFSSVSEPEWPTELFDPLSRTLPAPPTEPPRAA